MDELPGNCELLRLDNRSDDRGGLIALESGRQVPFDIKRVYYLFGTRPEAERGFHAHRELRQLAVCVAGSCVVTLDDGIDRREIVLDGPDKALFIGQMVWREMRHFSSDAVLMVLASAHYDEADYIRRYDDFTAIVRQGAAR